MPLATGQTLTHYEILAPLGVGGMGEVYRARDTRLDREVAIKVLPEHFADDVDRLLRFEREAKTLASLNHPNVAGIHGIDQVGDTCFLAMELVPGEDLAAKLARGPLPVVEGLDVCRQIAEGLEAAHEAGVVHRDLKPANVRVTPDGVVKLLDFGLAKPIHPKTRSEGTTAAESDSFLATEDGLVLGTPTYMSPEQARGKPVDRRTDIWAFGCVVYECFAGRQAFTGDNVAEILAAILDRDVDFESLPASVPVAARELIRRCLVKEPRRRLRDIGEARLVLESALDPVRAGAGASLAVPTTRSRDQRSPSGLLGVVALAAIALAAWGWLRDTAAPAPEVIRFPVLVPADRADQNSPRFAFSPDGRILVYRTTSSVGESQLLIRPLHELETTSIKGASHGVVSADGSSLAYVTSVGDLLVRPLAGGTPRHVRSQVSTSETIAWADDGYLYYSPAGGGEGVWRVPSTGGEAVEIFAEDPRGQKSGYDWAEISDALPGGEHVLVSVSRQPGVWPVFAFVDVESGRRSEFIEGLHPRYTAGFVVFLGSTGTLMAARLDSNGRALASPPRDTGIAVDWRGERAPAFAVSRRGDLVYTPPSRQRAQMVWVSRDGTETSVAPDFWADIESVALDKGGERIAISMAESDVSAIWIHDMTSETRSRLTFEGYEVWRPLWHPDDERIAYVSDRGRSDATRSLWIQRADGSDEPVLLVQSDRHAQELTWSADGRAAVYREGFSDGGSMRDLHVLHSPESSEPRPFLTTEANEYCPKLSPDGRFLAYVSDASGRDEVYVRSFPSGTGLWQVSSEGGTAPLWRRDGQELFYIRRDGVLVAVPVLEEASFAMGPHEELFSTQSYHRDANSTSFDIDPGGERFLMIKMSDNEMIVVLNWVEEVRRLFEDP